MTVTLDTREARRFIRRRATFVKAGREELGEAAVTAIQAGPWPVRTGLSKRSFGYRIDRRGRVVITNTARSVGGFPYPIVVERRTRAIEMSLRPLLRSLGRKSDRAIKQEIRKGRF